MLTTTGSSVRSVTHWVTDPLPAAVPQVRARVRAVLDGWRIPLDESDALLLAVSELVGNVVRHVGAGRMRVAVASGGGWLRLEVADQGASLPRLPSPRAAFDADTENGRGLLMVQLMVAGLGGELAVVADEFGKSVHVRIPAV
ncbi:ATP-binding protein [Streptomyces sp. NPDC059193]|uniref:ATP-binding protein n=1 Tax=Streptomyces sp. NPDC059193 TaxID=3346763 RepID=UPI0036ACD11E